MKKIDLVALLKNIPDSAEIKIMNNGQEVALEQVTVRSNIEHPDTEDPATVERGKYLIGATYVVLGNTRVS